jgi:hypothetical protein
MMEELYWKEEQEDLPSLSEDESLYWKEDEEFSSPSSQQRGKWFNSKQIANMVI